MIDYVKSHIDEQQRFNAKLTLLRDGVEYIIWVNGTDNPEVWIKAYYPDELIKFVTGYYVTGIEEIPDETSSESE